VVSGEVIERAKRSDADALGEIVRVHHIAILRYLQGMAPGHAEELARQVWVDAASSLAGFEGDGRALREWLFALARRRATDARASGSHHPMPFTAPALVECASAGRDASMTVEWALGLLNGLAPTQAEVVILRLIEDFSVDEVARLIGKSEAAVRILTGRGLEGIVELLGAEEGVPVGLRGETGVPQQDVIPVTMARFG
jgi:RNA polymerase sigma-70 factor (ECF subfamily)